MFTVIGDQSGVLTSTRDQRKAELVYRHARDEAAAGKGPHPFEGVQLLSGDMVVHQSLGVFPYAAPPREAAAC
jgi:hypothetical protein